MESKSVFSDFDEGAEKRSNEEKVNLLSAAAVPPDRWPASFDEWLNFMKWNATIPIGEC